MSTDNVSVEVDGDVEPEMAALLKCLGSLIGKDMPEGFGFALMLFNDKLESYYVGTAHRKTLIKVLRQFIKENETN